MTDRLWAGLRRFLKVFITGGLVTISGLLMAGVSVTNEEELKTFGYVLVTNFVTGGLLALHKMYTFVE
jgi:hypothetical protein